MGFSYIITNKYLAGIPNFFDNYIDVNNKTLYKQIKIKYELNFSNTSEPENKYLIGIYNYNEEIISATISFN